MYAYSLPVSSCFLRNNRLEFHKPAVYTRAADETPYTKDKKNDWLKPKKLNNPMKTKVALLVKLHIKN
ncbi:hypothetical protein BSF_00250 [Bacillus subtilis]|nr:hypothetical protein BSF_00250 [Bacillus subtilis]